MTTQKEGVFVPLVQINCHGYVIKVAGKDEPFDNEWEEKIEYNGFNLEIKDGLWISGIGSLLTFKSEEYCGCNGFYKDGPFGIPHYFSKNKRYSKTLDGHTVYSDFKYDFPSGKYLLSVKGYIRKNPLESPDGNCGFFFYLSKVDSFNGFKDSREEEYDFNVENMK